MSMDEMLGRDKKASLEPKPEIEGVPSLTPDLGQIPTSEILRKDTNVVPRAEILRRIKEDPDWMPPPPGTGEDENEEKKPTLH